MKYLYPVFQLCPDSIYSLYAAKSFIRGMFLDKLLTVMAAELFKW